MSYRSIHTTYGLARIAAAEASGVPINLTHVAVGDGNGNPTTPTQAQTALVRETYRTTVNRVFQDPVDPNKFTVEMVIPAAVGGFVLREVGVFDSAGGLFAVGNLPDTYKPVPADGVVGDTVIRVVFFVTNATVITVQIDPAAATASQQWVLNTITLCHLAPGGTTGQILRKASNGCGDAEWADPTDVSVTVNSIEETQTLVAGQTVVDWSTVTNDGLAVYIEGVRLRADQWTKHPTIPTRITLAQSYPVGHKITGAQNEPAGSAIDPLAKAQNLADVPDKPLARTNLGVYSKAESDAAGQPGAVVHFARSTAPAGWLKANGAAVSRAAYAGLFAAIGTTFGAGDGSTTFNLPDLRGEFLRGLDDGRGVDTGRALGSAQADEIRSHTHDLPRESGGSQNIQSLSSTENSDEGVSPLSKTGATGGAETRPRNVALLACIKF